jgi:hypothetical protein
MHRSASVSEAKRTRGRGLRPSQSVGRLARGRARLGKKHSQPFSRHDFDDVDTEARKKVLSNYGMSQAKLQSSLKASSSVNEILHRWSYDSNKAKQEKKQLRNRPESAMRRNELQATISQVHSHTHTHTLTHTYIHCTHVCLCIYIY